MKFQAHKKTSRLYKLLEMVIQVPGNVGVWFERPVNS